MSTSSAPSVHGRRLLLVHAHPDDETIGNGATIARAVAEGAHVTVVTCTRGEQGEVIPAELRHLGGDALGDHRVAEFAEAMAALGVHDHRFLGDVLGDPPVSGRTAAAVLADGGRVYRDSGMAYDATGGVVPAPEQPEGAFTACDVEEPARWLAALLRRVRPHVVITYEPGGGYGHPDHVRAHLVTMRAVDLAAAPETSWDSGDGGTAEAEGDVPGPQARGDVPADGWVVPKVYWTAIPHSLAVATLRSLAAADPTGYRGPDPGGRLPSEVVPDDQVTTAVDASAWTSAKVAALRAHATQVTVTEDDAFFALSNEIRQPVRGIEFYRLVRGALAGERDDVGRETDLFAGVPT